MANNYYTATGNPLTRALSNSAYLRAEFTALVGAFDRLPDPLVGVKGFDGGTFSGSTLQLPTITNPTLTDGTVTATKLGLGASATTYATPSAALGTSGVFSFYRSSKTNNPFSLVFASSTLPANDDNLLFDKWGNVIFGNGTAAKGTTATDSFLMIPTCAGAPTGVPAHTYASSVPIMYDSTNNKIYVYDGGWIATAALT